MGGGDYSIVFNGEIYNFLELRNELIADGYIFDTNGDTEVILASFDKWGEKCLNKFNGMFAFGIWDFKRKVLFLARDRFGKKPLFYAFVDSGKKLVFASEQKAIYPFLKEVQESKEFSKFSNIHNIFQYESTNQTLIEGIRRFPYSHFAYYRFGEGDLRFQRYYNLLDNIEDCDISYDSAKEKFRELFLDAVNIRMRSDVPIGTALSGGLDSSSTICAMSYLSKMGIKPYSKDWQHAFVACFANTKLDESIYAKKVVDYIDINATFLEINPLAYWDNIEKYFYLFEDLYITSPVPMIATYEAVKKHNVSVTLDGHGADELFSGYGHLIEGLWDAKFNPKLALNTLNTLNQTRQDPLKGFPLYKQGAIFLIKKALKKLLNKGIQSKFKHHKNFGLMDNFTKELFIIFYESILPTLLRNYDRYSMINGVEIRMPFMDYRLVEFVFSLPFNYKFGNGYTKLLIRDSLQDIMPSDIAWRKSKIGFNSPIIEWIQRSKRENGLKEWFLDTLHSKDFLECPLVENPQDTLNLALKIAKGEICDFAFGEKLWCELNPYIWKKSLKYALRF